MVNIDTAAKSLGVSKDTLRRWEKKGKITAFRSPSGYRLYDLEALKKTESEEQLEEELPIAKKIPNSYLLLGGILLLSLLVAGGVSATYLLTKHQPNPSSDNNKVLTSVSKQISTITSRLNILESASKILGEQNINTSDSSTSFSSYIPQNVNTTTVNLLRNSSFEANSSGQPTYWSYLNQSTSNNTYVNNAVVRTGNHSLRIQPLGINNSDSGQGNSSFGIYQPYFGTLLNRDYTLSLFLNNQSNQSFILRLSFWDRASNIKILTKDININSSATGWNRYTYHVDPLDAYPMIELIGVTQGNVYIDDVQLEEGTVTSIFAQEGMLLGDGSVRVDENGNIYPVTDGNGSLGLSNLRFSSLYLSGATIDSSGNTSIAGNLSVAGSSSISSLLLADGTAAKPSLAFQNDTDTGLYRPGSDILGFTTGGTERVRIDSSGNVGVGTTTPTASVSITQSSSSTTDLLDFKTADFDQFGSIKGQNMTIKGTIQDSTNLAGAQSVVVAGRYAYIALLGDSLGSAVKGGIAIVDISDPADPTVVGSLTTGCSTFCNTPAIAVAGRYAYTLDRSSTSQQFKVIDVGNPKSPSTAGFITDSTNIGGAAANQGIYISGRYAYLGLTNRLTIVDISKPTAPTVSGSLSDSTNLGGFNAVYVQGKYAYVTASTADRLTVVDISDPTSPTVAGTVTNSTNLDGAFAVYVSGKYAYVGAGTSSRFTIVDISDPTSPTIVGTVSDANLLGGARVTVSGDYAYVSAANTSNTFVMIDVSDPTAPVVISSIDPGNGTANFGFEFGSRGSFISGRYAYITVTDDNRLTIVDLAGLDMPTALIGNLQSGYLSVQDNQTIGNDLRIGNGLDVGTGGIFSAGSVGIGDASNTAASFILTNNTATTIGNGANTLGVLDLQSTSLTTGNFMNIELNALTSGKGINLTSTNTAFTGSLIDVTLSGSNAANTGSLMTLTNSGTSNVSAGTLYLKHYGTDASFAFRVDDVASDTTPFVIVGTGNVGVGTSTPTSGKLQVDGGGATAADFMGVNISGNFSNNSASDTQYALYINPTHNTGTTSGFYGQRTLLAMSGGSASFGVGADIFSPNITSGTITSVIGLIVRAQSNTSGASSTTGGFFTRAANLTTGNQSGNTSGTNTNIGIQIDGAGGTAGAGGIVNNYGIHLTVPAGSNTGTTTNRGLYITGNGGTGTNYALYSDSTATSYLEGSLGIGTSAAPAGKVEIAQTNAANDEVLYLNTEESTATQTVFALESDSTGNSQSADTVKAHMTADGAMFISLTGTQTGTAICHTTDGKANNDELVDCSGALSDYAERYPVENGIDYGEIVTHSDQFIQDKSGVRVPIMQRSNLAYQNVIGVTSDNYSDFSSIGDNYDSSINIKPIALVGRVPVKVTLENGEIKRGDFVTTSSTPGKGMKALRIGNVIGTALDDYDPQTGTVMVFVKATIADPQNLLANLTLDQDGSLVIPKIKTSQITLADTSDTLLTTDGSSIQLTSLTQTGTPVNFSNTSDSITHNNQTLAQVLNNINLLDATQSSELAQIKDQNKVLSEQIASQSASLTESVNHTSNKLSDLSSQIDNLLKGVNGKEATNSSEINNLTDPSLLVSTDSASLAKLNITDTLFAKDINISSTLHSLDATISGTLKSLGDTFLGNTTIAGDITQDGTLSLSSGNSINSIDTLFIQSSPLAKLVDFFNGLVTIDKNGLLSTQKLAVSSQTLGTATIAKGQIETEVTTDQLTEHSKIFTSSNQAIAVGINKDLQHKKFTLKINSPQSEDLKIDWWIVDQK